MTNTEQTYFDMQLEPDIIFMRGNAKRWEPKQPPFKDRRSEQSKQIAAMNEAEIEQFENEWLKQHGL